MHGMTAGIDDQGIGCQQRLHFVQAQQAFLATHHQARRRCLQDARGAFDFGDERRDARDVRGLPGADKRGARALDAQTSNRHASNHQFMRGPRCRGQRRGVESGQHLFGGVQVPEQKLPAQLNVLRMRGIDAIAMLRQRCSRCFQCLHRPAQIARNQRDFRFGDDAARTGDGFLGAEPTCCPAQQVLGKDEIAQLRHGDTAQCESGGVFAQGHAFERAQRIAHGEGSRRGGDQ